VDGSGEEKLAAMGLAYRDLLEQDRELLRVQMQSQAASIDDPVIREASRAGFERIVALVKRESEADDATVESFFATGMLMNVVAALDIQELRACWWPDK
jgi:hypothetical protein